MEQSQRLLSQAQPWDLVFTRVHGACTLNSTPNPKSQNSPVLLPGVTAARIGLPKLSGKHPDDVNEKDEVELQEGACIGDWPCHGPCPVTVSLGGS